MDERLAAITQRARRDSVCPGGVLAFGDQERQEQRAFGTLTYGGGPSVTEDTIYDVASLTKPMSTVALAMKLVAEGKLDLDSEVATVNPAVAGGITFAHLLGHSSGLPAHIEFFREVSGRQQLLERAALVAPTMPTGAQAVYSDIGYLLLGDAVERLSGDRLDRLFQRHIAQPLGMTSSQFVDCSDGGRHPQLVRVAPTEVCTWRNTTVRGQVHDENAFAGGGICGHAGLFSTAGDVARFGRALVRSWAGAPDAAFDRDTVATFLSRSASPDASWRLGWDTPSSTPGVSLSGDRWPRQGAVGHLGFTGCSLWLHRDRCRYAVILTNRVHPTRDNQGIREVRRDLMDLIADELGTRWAR